ncbi:MAG: hypothetical protein KDM64_03980, partial [Verrucomicrobiae bacterium]|nr:hypothetical protein [Verrucomicrobiae bacterium]
MLTQTARPALKTPLKAAGRTLRLRMEGTGWSGSLVRDVPQRSLWGPALFSVVAHGAAIFGAACWVTLGAGEGGRGEVPVIEVSVAAVAPVETTGDGEDVMDEPPPVREATPLETEWDQPDPVETPPLPLEVERLAERPAEPVTEFLVAETGPSMVFP